MICESCNQNEATIHYTEIVNGVTTEHHLCSECAKDMDLSYYSGVLNNEFSFAKLLTGLLAASVMRAQENDSLMSHVICPKCGMNYEEFTNVGKFGCAECYNVFGPLIEEHLKKLHGNTANVSKKYMPNEKGKNADDVWCMPILNPMSNERLGYDTQKPKALIERIIKASSNEGDLVADFYMGSGTTAEVCKDLKRNFIGCDINPRAIEITLQRLNDARS